MHRDAHNRHAICAHFTYRRSVTKLSFLDATFGVHLYVTIAYVMFKFNEKKKIYPSSMLGQKLK